MDRSALAEDRPDVVRSAAGAEGVRKIEWQTRYPGAVALYP